MLARATYWLRGVELPGLDNKLANQLLVVMLAREQEEEIVKFDYLASAMAVLQGIPKEVYEPKMKALRDLKTTMVETVTQLGYDPVYRELRELKKKQELKKQAALVKQLDSFGKPRG